MYYRKMQLYGILVIYFSNLVIIVRRRKHADASKAFECALEYGKKLGDVHVQRIAYKCYSSCQKELGYKVKEDPLVLDNATRQCEKLAQNAGFNKVVTFHQS